MADLSTLGCPERIAPVDAPGYRVRPDEVNVAQAEMSPVDIDLRCRGFRMPRWKETKREARR